MRGSEASEPCTVVNQPYTLVFILVPVCSYLLPDSAIVGFIQRVTHETQGANSMESTQLSLCTCNVPQIAWSMWSLPAPLQWGHWKLTGNSWAQKQFPFLSVWSFKHCQKCQLCSVGTLRYQMSLYSQAYFQNEMPLQTLKLQKTAAAVAPTPACQLAEVDPCNQKLLWGNHRLLSTTSCNCVRESRQVKCAECLKTDHLACPHQFTERKWNKCKDWKFIRYHFA